METTAQDKTSVLTLIRLFAGDTRTFVRQEIQLAKPELSEKIAHMARNVALLAIGGVIAYAGLIVFLIALSWLIASLFEMAGLQPVVSGFLGLGIIGFSGDCHRGSAPAQRFVHTETIQSFTPPYHKDSAGTERK
jgi:hypothetical protein